MYWTEGQMSDSEFLEGIKFLINNGIIQLKQSQNTKITIYFESNNINPNSNFTVKVIDIKANTDSEFVDIVNLTITDGGPLQAGTTITQYVIASETGIDSSVFTFTGIVSDFIPISGEIHVIYETDSKVYEAFIIIIAKWSLN